MLTERVQAWQDCGAAITFRGRQIHTHARDGDGPALLLLHGFPSSSYDLRLLLEELPGQRAVTFDCLGFGLSDKPRNHVYGLGWQADLAQDVVRRAGAPPVVLVAHDMGTSVATELLARDLRGEGVLDIRGALLLNGSVILERAKPTLGQRLLRSPAGPLASRLSTERFFRQQFGQVFSAGHPLSAAEAADQWSLVTHNDGHRIGHLLVHYMDERITNAERWHGAIRDWPKPFHLAWGMLDPVAVPDVLHGLRELRPDAPVSTWDDVGHYPPLEAPDRLAAAVRGLLDAVV